MDLGSKFFLSKKKTRQITKKWKKKTKTKPASMEQQQQQLYSLYTGVG